MRRLHRLIGAGLCWVVLVVSMAHAADWPQFQGADRTGISSETGLARRWPTNGPPVLWSLAVGEGYAGVAVRAGRVYLLDRPTHNQDALRVLDLQSGQELWQYAFEAPGDFPYAGSRTVPTVETNAVYIQSASGLLQCLSLTDHKPVWSRNVLEEYRDRRLPKPLIGRTPQWGFTQNPTIAGDKLLVAPHALTAGLVALDKATGRELWRSADIGQNVFSHVTPYVTTLCGVEQVVTIANKDVGRDTPAIITGVELASGRVLWQTETLHRYNVPIPQPVRIAPNRLFITGGYTLGCLALELRRPTQPEAPWQVEYVFRDNPLVTSHLHNPLFFRGHIFAQSYDKFHQTKHNGLTCLDPAGRLKWKTGPDLIFGNGHLLIADGLLFVLHDPSGELILAEATPDQYRELGRAKLLRAQGGTVWAPMALAEGKLLLRDLHELKCVDVR